MFIVEAIDRLGRNYNEIIQMVHFLKEKEVNLIIASLPMMTEVSDIRYSIVLLRI